MTTPPPPETEEGAAGRRFNWWLAALLAIHCLVVWTFRYTTISFGDDDAGYLLLARSLSQFSYRDLQEIGAPIAARYPPGYPAFLAVWRLLVGESLPLLILLNTALSAGTLGLLAVVLRRIWSARLALAVTLVLSISTGASHYPGRVMSEPLFGFLLMLSLWALHDQPDQPGRFTVSTAAAVLAGLVRTAGAAPLAGLLGYWIWRRQWRRAAAFALVSAVTVGGWIGWTLAAPEGDTRQLYVNDFARGIRDRPDEATPATPQQPKAFRTISVLADRGVHNVETYLTRELPTVLSLPTVPGTLVDNIFWVGVLGLSLLFGIRAMAQRWLPAALAFAGYLGLLAIWPFALGRLATPVVPLLVLSIFLLALQLTKNRRSATAVLVGVTAVLVVGQAFGLARAYERSFHCTDSSKVAGRCHPPEIRAMLRLTTWLRDSLPAGARLMATKERPMHLLTGHQLVNFRTALSHEAPPDFVRYLRSNSVEYVVLTSVGYRAPDVWSRLRDSCGAFTVARFEEPDAFAFRLREPSETTDELACRSLDSWVGPRP